jgi:MoxR-like ATPase
MKTDSSADILQIKDGTDRLINNIQQVIYIQREKLEYLTAAKLAGGHVILADSHGVGKTSLARALAGSIEWEGYKAPPGEIPMEPFSRIQGTVDLLPQDIVGYNRLDPSGREMTFIRGPIFAHFLLCDEINLLTPKTQGGFFQAMEERTVSVEGRNYTLFDPFFIIATMNIRGVHLFPLPAPQLDRFMLKLSIGFPDAETESEIILQHGRDDAWKGFGPVIKAADLVNWRENVDEIAIHREIIDYMVKLIQKTRNHPELIEGASPRTGVKVSRLARALALVRGFDYVTVDLVKEIFIPAVAHRLELKEAGADAEAILREIMDTVPVPL